MKKLFFLFSIVALAWLLTGSVWSASLSITVNASLRYQTAEGFGTCVDGGAAPYNQAWLQDLYTKDMGGSFLRVVVDPSLAPNPVTFTSNLAANIALLNFNAAFIANEATFAQALNTRKLDSFRLYATPWSPPAYMKANNDTTDAGNGSSTTNHLIDTPANYQQYAYYLAAFCAGFQQAYGIPIYGVSVQNELMFNEPYNSCQYTDQEFHDVVTLVGQTFAAQGITTKVMGPESVGPDGGFFTTNQMGFINAVQSDGAVAPFLNIFNIHSYSSNGIDPLAPQRSWLTSYWSQIQPFGKESWMTETSGDAPSWLDVNSGGNQDGALFMGYRMNEDLAFGNDSTWFYWQITSGGDSADTFSLTGQNPGALVPPAQQPKYCAYKQFSRFIRPGAVRVDASPDAVSCNATAWVHDANKTLTVVLVNQDTQPATVSLALPSVPNVASFGAYRSSTSESFVRQADVPVSSQAASFIIPPQSILTLNGYDTTVVTPTPVPTDTPSPDCPKLFNGFETLTENGTWSGTNATRALSTAYPSQGTYCLAVTITNPPAPSPTSWDDQVANLAGFTPNVWTGYNSLTLDIYVDPTAPPWNGGWNTVYLYGNAPAKGYREISISPFGLQTGWNRVTFPLNWNLDTNVPAIGPTDALTSIIFVLQTSVPQVGRFYMDNMVLHTGVACVATVTPTPTLTGSSTLTPTPSSTRTASMTPSATATGTPTRTPTTTPTTTPSHTPTSSPTATPTASPTATTTRTPTVTPSPSPTNSPTLTPTATASPTSTATRTPAVTPTPTLSFTGTLSPSPTPTQTFTFSNTPSFTSTPSQTQTPTFTFLSTPTFTPSFTFSATSSATNSPTRTAIPSPSFTPTFTPSNIYTFTPTVTPSFTPTSLATFTQSFGSPVLFPNPAKGDATTLRFKLVNPAGNVSIRLFTTALRKIGSQALYFPSSGVQDVPINLVDKDGSPLANGIYYLVVDLPSGRWIGKLLVLR